MTDSVRNVVVGRVVGNVVQAGSATVIPPEARPTAVAGLPPPAVFVGRENELARLTAALEPGGSEAVLVWSVGGLPGVGKTALAVCAARQAVAAGWFPGGVVMTNLRGYDQANQRLTASTALAGLLGALGVADEHIPPEVEDRARLWRSLLADRERMLVVADNVSDPDQVVPLLPGDSRHQVLITSRHRMAGLDHTRLLDLDVLDVPDAVRMLAAVLDISNPDDTRAADNPVECERVAQLCGGLPLAVRVAAALLVADPERSVADLAEALADGRHRLRELNFDGSLAVRAAFDLSYAHLDPDQARLLRLTALDPGPDVGLDTIAAIADTDRTTALRLIRRLRAAHLVQPGQSADRWRMHDLVKLYAAEKAAEDPDHDRTIVRMLDHYLATVTAAGDSHGEVRVGTEAVRAVDAERANLVPVIDLAHTAGHPGHVVALTRALTMYFDLRKLWTEWISTHELALSAARGAGDREAEATLLVKLGLAHGQLLRTEVAMACFRAALPLFRRLGDRVGFAEALNRLGVMFRHTGRSRWAMACHTWARDLFREAGDPKGQLGALHNMAVLHRRLRDLDQAAALHLECLVLCRELGPLLEGRVLDQLGVTYREMGRVSEAIECHRRNLRITEAVADPHGNALTMATLAVTYRVADRLTEAVSCHLEALRTFRAFGSLPSVGQVLKELGATYREMGRDDDAVVCWAEALRVFEALPAVSAGAVADRTRRDLAALTAEVRTPPAASRPGPAPGSPHPTAPG
ncbi:tetratricopeptide (TPR) repeat protein [Saccharothrix ecbatanensis]|uniref:Tetratricopeptide (TPR) repeat protein n=1 Tax=Saccharothrix ecbatanensis TaxID=1105145 RepID=A0A7W9LZF2_9PSEU|nr:ATP-binding protein [Saccharothrix ecbatanensis]MBB5801643.1 tetratricopeptide (TPR) repeat protein [Saccharothrix ecbatanensis]